MTWTKKATAIGALCGWGLGGVTLSISTELGSLWPYSITTTALIGAVAYVVTRPAKETEEEEPA